MSESFQKIVQYLQSWDPKGANELLSQAATLVFQAQAKMEKGVQDWQGSLAQDAYRVRASIARIQDDLITKEIDK